MGFLIVSTANIYFSVNILIALFLITYYIFIFMFISLLLQHNKHLIIDFENGCSNKIIKNIPENR